MERDATVTLFARNIELAMTRRGMNPAQLQKAANLGATGIYDILSGKARSPRLDTVGKIARALGMPVAALFEEPEESELRDQIMDAIYRLPAEERRRILTTARAWAADTQSS